VDFFFGDGDHETHKELNCVPDQRTRNGRLNFPLLRIPALLEALTSFLAGLQEKSAAFDTDSFLRTLFPSLFPLMTLEIFI